MIFSNLMEKQECRDCHRFVKPEFKCSNCTYTLCYYCQDNECCNCLGKLCFYCTITLIKCTNCKDCICSDCIVSGYCWYNEKIYCRNCIIIVNS